MSDENKPEESQYFCPNSCDEFGNTLVPWIIKGKLVPGKSHVVVEEPQEYREKWPTTSLAHISYSDDTNPRRLKYDEVQAIVGNGLVSVQKDLYDRGLLNDQLQYIGGAEGKGKPVSAEQPVDYNSPVITTTTISAKAFLDGFADAPTKMASAVSYLATLAVDGNDKRFEEALPMGAGYTADFREGAHKIGLIDEGGNAHDATQAALTSFLASNAFYSKELNTIRNKLADTRKDRSPLDFVSTVGVTSGSSGLDYIRRKSDAIQAGDVDAIVKLGEEGAEFGAIDFNSAVHNTRIDNRADVVRAMCETGGSCPDWVKKGIKDPALTAIIDEYAANNQGQGDLPGRK